MTFSLKAVIDELSKYPEQKVMNLIMEQYELSRHGVLFNEKFIPMSEMLIIGFSGFKQLLYSLLETDEDFLELCLPELRAIMLSLKGEI